MADTNGATEAVVEAHESKSVISQMSCEPSQNKQPDKVDAGLAERLAEYEELFKDRYTERDPDFAKVVQTGRPPPPCVYPFYAKQKRTFDNTRTRPEKRPWEQSSYSSAGWSNSSNDVSSKRFGSYDSYRPRFPNRRGHN